MSLFRRARGKCSACDREKSVDVGELTDTGKVNKAKVWRGACNGCGAELTLPIPQVWWVGFRSPDGRSRRRRIGPDRAAAKRVLAKVRTELTEGAYVERRQSCKVTLGELLEAHLADTLPRRKPGVEIRLRTLINVLVRVLGKTTRIDRLDRARLEGYRDTRIGEGKVPATVARELAHLSGSLTWSVKQGMLVSRPSAPRIQVENTRFRWLTRDEAARLVEACDADAAGEWLGDFVRLAIATGCRRGELLALEWAWVDAQANVLNLPGEATKNGKPRVVPLNVQAQEVLRRRQHRGVARGPFVFHKPGTIEPLSGSTLDYGFVRAVTAVGLWRPARDPMRVTPHTLRHTAASWMVQAGIDLFTVAAILGHRDLKQTQRYSHLSPEGLAAAVAQVCFEGAGLPPSPGTTPPPTHTHTREGEDPAKVIPLFGASRGR